ASLMVAAAIKTVGDDAALQLLGALYRAVWAEDRGIGDHDTLIQIADECQVNGRALHDASAQARELYDQFTQRAIDLQVFGAPWYIYNDEPFWGQDRLEFLDRALANE